MGKHEKNGRGEWIRTTDPSDPNRIRTCASPNEVAVLERRGCSRGAHQNPRRHEFSFGFRAFGPSWTEVGPDALHWKLMSKPAIHVSEAEAASDFSSLLARVRAGAEVVIERNAEAVAVLRPATPSVRLLSESLRLATERGSKTTLDAEFGRDLDAVVSSHREPFTPPA